jgi:hypothetical protein
MVWACGSQRIEPATTPDAGPTVARVVPLARAIVVETSGPSPSDTSVSFVAGSERVIILRHGPPENIVFAELSFSAGAFGDSGQVVTAEVRPRPGVYGLDLSLSVPLQSAATLAFYYARYFSAPARARQLYKSDVAFERALSVGRVLSENQIELLPSRREELDHVSASIPGPGSYLVAAAP